MSELFKSSISLSLAKADTVVPTTACHQPSFKVDTAVPTAACHQTSVKSLTSLFSATAISKPIVNRATAVKSMPTRSRLPVSANRAKTTPVLPKHTQQRSLAAKLAAPISDAVTARIQKRHQLTVAKLTAAKGPQQPVKATRPVKAPVTAIATTPCSLPTGVPTPRGIWSTYLPVGRSASPASTATPNILPSTRKYVWVVVTMICFRQNGSVWSGHTSQRIVISDESFNRPILIPQPSRHPSTASGHRIRTLTNPANFRQVYLRLRRSPRGSSPYCGGTQCGDFVPSFDSPSGHGRDPSCQPTGHRNDPSCQHSRVQPREWGTTLAEEVVHPKRASHSKRVHWGSQVAQVVGTFERWYMEAYGRFEETDDPPSPLPSPPPSPPPLLFAPEQPPHPCKPSFEAAWKVLMEEPFADDIDY